MDVTPWTLMARSPILSWISTPSARTSVGRNVVTPVARSAETPSAALASFRRKIVRLMLTSAPVVALMPPMFSEELSSITLQGGRDSTPPPETGSVVGRAGAVVAADLDIAKVHRESTRPALDHGAAGKESGSTAVADIHVLDVDLPDRTTDRGRVENVEHQNRCPAGPASTWRSA